MLLTAHFLHDEIKVFYKIWPQKMRTLLFFFFGLVYSNLIWPFTCYYTVAKDSCWLKYNVSVDVIDGVTSKTLLTVNLPPGIPWVRERFECSAEQNLIYIAKFSPVFWKNEENKTYRGYRNWSLPGTIHPGDTAWTISICYPSDFAQVPLPPDAGNNCKCDFSLIPSIKSP
jgi:hypothetical protein